MPFGRGPFLGTLILVFCFFAATLARAADLVVFDSDRRPYILKSDGKTASLTPVKPMDLKKDSFYADSSSYQLGDLTVFLNDAGQAILSQKGIGQIASHQVLSTDLPPDRSPASAAVDGYKNIYLTDQEGDLFRVILPDHRSLLARDLLSGGVLEGTKAIFPLPQASGFLAVSKDGSLQRIMINPQKTGNPLEVHSVLGPGMVQDIYPAGDSHIIFFEEGSGFGQWSTIANPHKVTAANVRKSAVDIETLLPASSSLEEIYPAEDVYRDDILTAFTGSKPKVNREEEVETPEPDERRFYPEHKLSAKVPRKKFDHISDEDRREISEFMKILEKITLHDLTQEAMEAKNNGTETKIHGREAETDQVLDTLIRQKGKNPVLVGEAGVGKTTIAKNIAQLIVNNKLPEANRYQEILKDAIVIETSASALSKLADNSEELELGLAIEKVIGALEAVQRKLKRKIVLYVDEMHQLTKGQIEALKSTLDSKEGILLIGSTTNSEIKNIIQYNPAMRRRLQRVPVPEFSVEETKKLLKEVVAPEFAQLFGSKTKPAEISDEALDAAIVRAADYLPESARPEGPIKTLQDALIESHRKAGKKSPSLNAKDVGGFVTRRLGIPLDPTDLNHFYKQIENLKGILAEEVVEQKPVTDAMADLWRDANLGSAGKDSFRVMLIPGPTGTGKTLSAKTFGKHALGSEERVLEIDATQYQDKDSLWKLFGPTVGYLGSDQTRGILPEFLDGRGRGANVIVINELGRACPEFHQALMELFDTGAVQAGDGNTYRLGRSLIVLTTNAGDDQIYPRGRGKALSRAEIEKRRASLTDSKLKELSMKAPKGEKGGIPAAIMARVNVAKAQFPLSREGAINVAKKEAAKKNASLKDRKIKIEWNDEVFGHLVDSVYIPENGVRSVRDAVSSTFNNALNAAITDLKLKEGESIAISYDPLDSEAAAYSVARAGSKKATSISAAVPANVVVNPLTDPSARKKLANLETELKAIVLGQDDAIAMTSKALRSRAANPQGSKPAVMLYLGSTGTGKTQLAKGVADKLFSGSDRFISFDMGKVNDKSKLGEIFGSPIGYEGGNLTSRFEQFILDFPEGGVILFDEIGNMGDSSPEGQAVKAGLLKIFYAMMDEGKWTNNVGKTYDLSKFALIFTSNEGQELVNGVHSDDLRLLQWKKSNSPEVLTAELKKHGWTEAMIARFRGNIALFKPLLEAEQAAVGEMMVRRAMRPLMETHGIKDFSVQKDFYRKVAETFFSHEQGARALDSVADQALTDLLLRGIFESDDGKFLKDATVHLSLEDNYSGLHRYEGDERPVRKVTLQAAIVGKNKKRVVHEMDLTKQAAPKKLQSQVQSVATAIHEAGHALVNDPGLTGRKVDSVSIRSGGGAAGYASYSEIGRDHFTRENLVASLAVLLAGREAEKRAGLPPDSGWSSDLQQAKLMAEKGVVKLGLSKNPLRIASLVEQGAGSDDAQEAVLELLEEAEKMAHDVVKQNEKAIHELATLLFQKGFVDGSEVEEIRKRHGMKTSGEDNLSPECRKLINAIAAGR